MNPHIRSIGDRYQTFIESENWPSERIAADPKLIADAINAIAVNSNSRLQLDFVVTNALE